MSVDPFLLLAAFSAAETPSATRGKKAIDDAIAALGGGWSGAMK